MIKTKCWPFESAYLQDFIVLEEHDGNVCKFPHTNLLPKLLRALNLEFHAHLPQKVASADARASDYVKLFRHTAAILYCGYINQARPDKIRLQALLDRNRVSRISIVQQSTEDQAKGPLHRFKFYAGQDFFTEVHVNGRRIVVAEHVLKRFSERIPNPAGTDLTVFLDLLFTSPALLMQCGDSAALVYPNGKSIIAFPVWPSDSDPEYFLATCLTGQQINDLKCIEIPVAYTPHYDPVCEEPEVRNWNPVLAQVALYLLWKKQVSMQQAETPQIKEMTWAAGAMQIKDFLEKQGHGIGSKFLFRDNIFGPSTVKLRPTEQEPRHAVLDELKKLQPQTDWAQMMMNQKKANPAWH